MARGYPAWTGPAPYLFIWYFTFSTVWPDEYQVVKIDAQDQEQAAECRAQLVSVLMERRSLVVHDMGGEIDEVRLIETLWPCERATRVRQAVEKEHAERSPS